MVVAGAVKATAGSPEGVSFGWMGDRERQSEKQPLWWVFCSGQ